RTLTTAWADRGHGPGRQRPRRPALIRLTAGCSRRSRGPRGPLPGARRNRERTPRAYVGTVDGLINDRGADAATLEEELAIVGAGPRLQVLVPCGGRCRHVWSSNDPGSFYP